MPPGVVPQNLEVSFGAAQISMDSTLGKWQHYSNIQVASLELSTTHLKMDFIVKFYMTFFHNSEESSKINPSRNFGMQHEDHFGNTLQKLHETLHCVCMHMHTHKHNFSLGL